MQDTTEYECTSSFQDVRSLVFDLCSELALIDQRGINWCVSLSTSKGKLVIIHYKQEPEFLPILMNGCSIKCNSALNVY